MFVFKKKYEELLAKNEDKIYKIANLEQQLKQKEQELDAALAALKFLKGFEVNEENLKNGTKLNFITPQENNYIIIKHQDEDKYGLLEECNAEILYHDRQVLGEYWLKKEEFLLKLNNKYVKVIE